MYGAQGLPFFHYVFLHFLISMCYFDNPQNTKKINLIYV